MDARLDWIWMQTALGPGSPRSDSLLRAFGRPSALREARGQGLEAFGLSQTQRQRLADPGLKEAEAILKRAKELGVWLLTPEDALYPSLLRGIPGLPLVLYGLGSMPDLELAPPIAVAGTRSISEYGRRVTGLIAGGLVRGGAALIAGGALGTETLAHEAALNEGGVTVSVQATGLALEYPGRNKELRRRILSSGGALLSEYPPDEPARRLTYEDFRMCNRIISGMALGVCVVEAGENSGSLMVARHAREQGRDVYAVAGDILTGRSAGTDGLIRDGARLVRGPEEILEEYADRYPLVLDPEAARAGKPAPSRPAKAGKPAEPPKEPAPPADLSGLSEGARRVWDALEDGPLLTGALAERCGMPVPLVAAALTELEMRQAAKRLPGQLYGRG